MHVSFWSNVMPLAEGYNDDDDDLFNGPPDLKSALCVYPSVDELAGPA